MNEQCSTNSYLLCAVSSITVITPVPKSGRENTDSPLWLSVVEVIIAALTLQVGLMALIVGLWRNRYRRPVRSQQAYELEARGIQVRIA